MGVVNIKVKLKIVPPPGIAPGLPAPQAGVLLLYYSGEARLVNFVVKKYLMNG